MGLIDRTMAQSLIRWLTMALIGIAPHQFGLAHDLDFGDPAICPAYKYVSGTTTPLYELATQEDVNGFRKVVGEECSILDGVLLIGAAGQDLLASSLSPISDLTALHWVEQIGTLKIENASDLVSLHGLENIRGETQAIIIRNAPRLQNIEALSGITTISDLGHGTLGIAIEGTALKSLRPINGIKAQGKYWGFVVRDNPLLSDCEWPDSGDPPESPLIRDNFLGCNNVAEVMEYWGDHRHELHVSTTPGGLVSLNELSPGFVMSYMGLETGSLISDPKSAASDEDIAHWLSVPIPSGHSFELRGTAEPGFEQLEIQSNCFGGKQYFGGERWVISSMRDDCYFFVAFSPINYPSNAMHSLHSSVCHASNDSSEKEISRRERGITISGTSKVDIVCSLPRKAAPQVWAFVKQLYALVLEMPPDRRLDNIILKILSGDTLPGDIAAEFLLSEEYENKRASDADFIATLYRALLNRPYTSEEFAYYSDLLAGGIGRDEVVMGFVNSAEFSVLSAEMLRLTTPSQTNLQIGFVAETEQIGKSFNTCKLVHKTLETESLEEALVVADYFRIPGVVLSADPLSVFISPSLASHPLNAYAVSCRLSPGVGITNISLMEN